MSTATLFPSLDGFEPTRQTLQWYSRIVAVVPRAYAEPNPRWWHISLRVQPDGLVSTTIPLPGGGSFYLKLDLEQHNILLLRDQQVLHSFSMILGISSTALGDQILGTLAQWGLKGEYARETFENDEPRTYDEAQVDAFRTALVNADRIFKQHRATLDGERGPVQLWPHGFDLAFEWFGSRVETYEEHGEVREYPSQLNLGFYPGDPSNDAYFYSNPWPFESAVLLGKPLPIGARWHTEGWQGTVLPYAELVDNADAEQRLREYARIVYELASPTLLAE